MLRKRTDLTGATGEYYVAAELARMGYVASLTLKNTQGIDILVTNPETGQMVAIQVKTRQAKADDSSAPKWVLREPPKGGDESTHFYVFVNLVGNRPPEYFIVPRRVVARETGNSHRRWLKGRRRDGGARMDTPMRKFEDKDGQYKSKWGLLWEAGVRTSWPR